MPCYMTLLVVFCCIVQSLSAGGSQMTQQAEPEWEALAARANQGDHQALEQLTDVLSFKDRLNSIVPGAGDSVKARLLRAEENHRQGKQHGITNEDVAQAINRRVREMQLPSYALVTTDQVIFLRSYITQASPHMMTLKDKRFLNNLPAHGSWHDMGQPALSPTQGIYVAYRVAQAKLFNPDLQVSPDEWPQQRKDLEAKLQQQLEEARRMRAQGVTSRAADVAVPPRRRDLEDRVAAFAKSADLPAVMHRVLDDLGIMP
jgi:hypothetical protein